MGPTRQRRPRLKMERAVWSRAEETELLGFLFNHKAETSYGFILLCKFPGCHHYRLSLIVLFCHPPIVSMDQDDSESQTASNSETNSDIQMNPQDVTVLRSRQSQDMALIMASIIQSVTQNYILPLYNKILYHTSILTGEMWV